MALGRTETPMTTYLNYLREREREREREKREREKRERERVKFDFYKGFSITDICLYSDKVFEQVWLDGLLFKLTISRDK